MNKTIKDIKEILKHLFIGIIIFGFFRFVYNFDFNVSLVSASIGMMSLKMFEEIEKIKKRLDVIERSS